MAEPFLDLTALWAGRVVLALGSVLGLLRLAWWLLDRIAYHGSPLRELWIANVAAWRREKAEKEGSNEGGEEGQNG